VFQPSFISRRRTNPRLRLRQALQTYWPFLIGLPIFQLLIVFVPIVRNNDVLFGILFLSAILPAMWPLFFGDAPFSFWVAACAYWFFGFILLVALVAALYVVFNLKIPGAPY
jgi:hypothetical protein